VSKISPLTEVDTVCSRLRQYEPISVFFYGAFNRLLFVITHAFLTYVTLAYVKSTLSSYCDFSAYTVLKLMTRNAVGKKTQ